MLIEDKLLSLAPDAYPQYAQISYRLDNLLWHDSDSPCLDRFTYIFFVPVYIYMCVCYESESCMWQKAFY